MTKDMEAHNASSKTALTVLAEFDAEDSKKKEGKKSVTDAWVRDQLAELKTSSLATKSIFSFCFVASTSDPFSCVYGLVMAFVALFIQTVVPLCIIVTLQPLNGVDVEPRACPNRSDALTKLIGAVLSLYFVVLTVSLCSNKLRGLAFLNEFIYLGTGRSMFVKIGILSQMVGMGTAGFAQYLLFIGNGSASYLILLLQSLAMQFCLKVDQTLVPDQIGKLTSSRISKLSTEELICDVGCGGDGPVPPEIVAKVTLLTKSEVGIIVMLCTVGVVWIGAISYCM